MSAIISDPRKRAKVINDAWDYLASNFSKFSMTNKIKVALEIIKRDMPTKVEGEGLAQRVVQVVYTQKENNDRSPESSTAPVSREIPKVD